MFYLRWVVLLGVLAFTFNMVCILFRWHYAITFWSYFWGMVLFTLGYKLGRWKLHSELFIRYISVD